MKELQFISLGIYLFYPPNTALRHTIEARAMGFKSRRLQRSWGSPSNAVHIQNTEMMNEAAAQQERDPI
jgi:hypothetical protein